MNPLAPVIAHFKAKGKRVIIDLLVLGFTIAGWYFGVSRYNRQTKLLEKSQTTIEEKEMKINALQARNDFQRLQIENLVINKMGFDNCLDILTKPAWRKRVVYTENDTVFVMDRTNKAYQKKYILKGGLVNYYGNLDKVVHGPKGDDYRVGDIMALLAQGLPIERMEYVGVVVVGRDVLGKFEKWWVKVGGIEYVYGKEEELFY